VDGVKSSKISLTPQKYIIQLKRSRVRKSKPLGRAILWVKVKMRIPLLNIPNQR